MEMHGLTGWSFQFDDASSRAGQCQYGIRVISMARQYCLEVSEDEWVDTLLHEIAHAIVGPGHWHDEVWERKARELGCTAERCHSVAFATPNHIISCPKCGWAGQRIKRTRGLIYRQCRSAVLYEPISNKRWAEAQNRSQARIQAS